MQALFDGFAHRHHVHAGGKRHPQRECWLTVSVVEQAGRFIKVPTHRGDIPQTHLLCTARRADDQLFQLADVVEFAGRMNADGAPGHQHSTGIGHHILVLDQGKYPGRVNAQAGQFGLGHLHHHLLLKGAGNRDLLDTRHHDQLPLEIVGVIFQVSEAVAFAGDVVQHAKYITVVVHHHRWIDAGRQATLAIGNFTPQLIPDLRQLAVAVFLFYLDHDLRLTVTADRINALDVLQQLNRLFQRQRHLFFHLFRRGTRIVGNHHRLFDGELGKLQLPQAKK